LRNPQSIDEFADAALAAAEEIEDSQPRRIGDGPKCQVNRVGGFGFHIRLCKYNEAAKEGKRGANAWIFAAQAGNSPSWPLPAARP
jgi:hypothetical protein